MPKRIIASFLLLLFFILLSLHRLTPPNPVLASAASTVFASGRAMQHVKAIAQKPHPIGSAESTNVRNYIVKELTTQGLTPQIQSTTAIHYQNRREFFSAGTVHNVVTKLSGTHNTKAVLLIAHYDSVSTGVGASDDGAGVAVLLETLRALRANPTLNNDVIFLFTDGEEAGLLGAQAFVEEHPWARDIGLVLNFEARGTSGSALMFETSPENRWMVEEFAKVAPHPIANSLTTTVYKQLPNDTDLTIFKQAGFAGLNFAYINDLIHYHTGLDRLSNVSERSLQHQGNYALASVRHFGNLNLNNPPKGDAVYFDVLGSHLLHYSERWVIPIALTVSIFFAGVVLIGLQRNLFTLPGILLGAIVFLVSILSTTVVVTLTWWLITQLNSSYRSIPQGDIYNRNFYIVAFVFLAITTASSIYTWCNQRISALSLTVGALFCWLLLMLVTSIYLPGASYLFAWALFFDLLGLGFILVSNQKLITSNHLVVLSLGAIPGIVILTPTIFLIFIALTLRLSGIAASVVVLLLGLLIPHIFFITQQKKWMLSALSAFVSLSLVLLGALTTHVDAAHPKFNGLFYSLNAGTQHAVWGSSDNQPDAWTSKFLTANATRASLANYLPVDSQQFLTNPAPVLPLMAPTINLLSDTVSNNIRSLHLRITSPRKARIVRVQVDSQDAVLAALVNGKTAYNDNTHASTAWKLIYAGLPKAGIELVFQLKSHRPVTIQIADQSDGLPEVPGQSIDARPIYMTPSPSGFGLSDVVIVNKSFNIKRYCQLNRCQSKLGTFIP